MPKHRDKFQVQTKLSNNRTVLDGASLFDLCEALRERFNLSKVSLDYAALTDKLDYLRLQHKWPFAQEKIVLLSVDPNSEGQQRFQTMLRHAGFELDVVNYRDTYLSGPPGKSSQNEGGKPQTSLASRMAYITGLMARASEDQDAYYLVVSHSYELCGPLMDLATRLTFGRVGLAYFGSFLDFRWKLAGLFDGKLGIDFFDLDQFGDEIIGIELIERDKPYEDSKSGLGRY